MSLLVALSYRHCSIEERGVDLCPLAISDSISGMRVYSGSSSKWVDVFSCTDELLQSTLSPVEAESLQLRAVCGKEFFFSKSFLSLFSFSAEPQSCLHSQIREEF